MQPWKNHHQASLALIHATLTVCGLLLPAAAALAGLGFATSEPTLLDPTFPELALEPVPEHLVLQAGQAHTFSWASSDANPGLTAQDFMARILVQEDVADSISWHPFAEGFQWDWTALEIQSALCRLEVSVRDIMGNTTTRRSEPFTVLMSTTDVPEADPATGLAAPFPNPFNPSCRVSFSLARPGYARLSVHDLRGRRLRVLHQGALDRGRHDLNWDGADRQGRPQPGGAYFFVLEVRENGQERRHVQRAVLIP